MAASCPNTNLPEWNTLVEAVGQLEAYKDFMETGGKIRTPPIPTFLNGIL